MEAFAGYEIKGRCKEASVGRYKAWTTYKEIDIGCMSDI